MRKRERRYRFTDEGIASDTVIALVFSILTFCLILGLVIFAVKNGRTGQRTAMLLAAAVVMEMTAIVFSVFSMRAQTGGMKSKRLALWITVIDAGMFMILWCL